MKEKNVGSIMGKDPNKAQIALAEGLTTELSERREPH